MKAGPELLTDLLQSVSRSFYLTLRVLPGAVRPQIGLAYLLARATDTIADTKIVPVEERLAALSQLRARILGTSSNRLDFTPFSASPETPPSEWAERSLLARMEEALAVLGSFAPEDQQRIREVLSMITSGQELDLRRFGQVAACAGSGGPGLAALESAAELDDYTYRVAGCVGQFWTRLCRAHLFPRAPLNEPLLMENAVRFGKGLQLVNILRDLPRDLRLGRCYLPARQLAAAGLTPEDLLDPSCELRARPIYNDWVGRAEEHLAAGWAYTNTLPRRCVRVRLACAWPILIGVKTLARLRDGNVLEPERRLKVSRAEVRQIVVQTVLRYPFASAWSRLWAKAAGKQTAGEPRQARK